MKTKANVLIGITIFAIAFPVFAKIHFTIDVEFCAKNASHIVIATEGDSIDGQLTILESWKGDLKPGDKISLPELKGLKEIAAREVNCVRPMPCRKDAPPEYITCSRMLLFLQSETDSLSQHKRWSGAASGDVMASTIWIEGKSSFAFWDRHKNKNGFLSYYSIDEDKIKAIISAAKV